MLKKIHKNTIWIFLSLLFYRIVLDLSYYYIISDVWRSTRFDLKLNLLKLIESYLLFFFIYILIPKVSKKLSYILLWMLILISYVPMLTIFAFMDESRIFMYAVTAFWAMVLLLVKMPTIFIARLKQSRLILYSLFGCLGIIVALMVYWHLGFSFTLDLKSVYEIRSEYVAANIPFSGYLWNWMAYIVNPIFMALFVTRKKWFLVVLVGIVQIWLFSATGIKTYLFSPLLVLVLMWIVKQRNPLASLGVGLACVVLAGVLSYLLINDLWVSSLLTRRFLFVPAQLSFFYYGFFSMNEPVFLSHSILRYFLDYPYHLDPPHLIADVFFNKPQMGSNNGIVGDAYMNFRLFGLILWGVLLVIILKLIDSCSKGVDIRVAVAAIAMPAITLTNSALLTNLLTHGLLLSLFILYLMPKQGRSPACLEKPVS
jgi:O-antigen polymerase